MINKAKVQLKAKLAEVDRKCLNGVSDIENYYKLVGEHRAYTDAINICNEVSKLDEDADADD